MKIDIASDLHGHYPELDGGDLLIIAGDLTSRDQPNEYALFVEWVQNQTYTKKIVVAGNHDGFIEDYSSWADLADLGFEYLCDSGTEFEGLKIWGSPWTAQFPGINPHCCAFTVPFSWQTESFLYDYFIQIPVDTDILITHGPAYGILDQTVDGRHVGSKALYNWIKYVSRPLIHCFGHIHEAYGQEEYFATHNVKMMKSINASLVNEKYKPVNKPITVIL